MDEERFMIETRRFRYSVGDIVDVAGGREDLFSTSNEYFPKIISRITEPHKVIGVYQVPIYDVPEGGFEKIAKIIEEHHTLELMDSLICVAHSQNAPERVKSYIGQIDSDKRVKVVPFSEFLDTNFSKKPNWNLNQHSKCLEDSITSSLKYSREDYGLSKSESDFLLQHS